MKNINIKALLTVAALWVALFALYTVARTTPEVVLINITKLFSFAVILALLFMCSNVLYGLLANTTFKKLD